MPSFVSLALRNAPAHHPRIGMVFAGSLYSMRFLSTAERVSLLIREWERRSVLMLRYRDSCTMFSTATMFFAIAPSQSTKTHWPSCS